MEESLDGLDRCHTLQQDMRTDNIVVSERIRVAETQIDMRLCSKMEDRINLVRAQALQDIIVLGEISMEELEIRSTFQHPGVVERTAIVELVEADDVVCVWVLCH